MKNNLFTPSELKSMQASVFTEEQIKLINAKTPKSEVEIKTDKNGFTYKSVKASYIKRRMNLIFGFNYSFEIKSHEFIQASKEVLVEGRLTIHTISRKVYREQFGQHYLQTTTEPAGSGSKSFPSDIGNGYKAAASDCFKKCASEFGICWDIYNQEHAEEKKEILPELSHAEKKILERLEHFLSGCQTAEDIETVYNNFTETTEPQIYHEELMKKHMNRVLKA